MATAAQQPPQPAHMELRIVFISAGAAVLGALAGGGFTYLAAVHQGDVEESLAAKEVRRQIYSSFYTTLDDYADLLPNEPLDKEEYDRLLPDLRAAEEEIRQAHPNVLLIGSDSVTNAANTVSSASFFITIGATNWRNEAETSEWQIEWGNPLASAHPKQDFGHLMALYLEAARQDVAFE